MWYVVPLVTSKHHFTIIKDYRKFLNERIFCHTCSRRCISAWPFHTHQSHTRKMRRKIGRDPFIIEFLLLLLLLFSIWWIMSLSSRIWTSLDCSHLLSSFVVKLLRLLQVVSPAIASQGEILFWRVFFIYIRM